VWSRATRRQAPYPQAMTDLGALASSSSLSSLGWLDWP